MLSYCWMLSKVILASTTSLADGYVAHVDAVDLDRNLDVGPLIGVDFIDPKARPSKPRRALLSVKVTPNSAWAGLGRPRFRSMKSTPINGPNVKVSVKVDGIA